MVFSDRRNQMILIEAVLEGMKYLRSFQGGHLPDDPEVKDDKTLLTKVDRENEIVIAEYIHKRLPSVKIVSEEGTEMGDGQTHVLLDPVDGTRALSCGLMTSTIIAAPYDTEKEQVVGCVIGEAVSGRVWYAFGDQHTQLHGKGHVNVWTKPMDEQSSIFLDVPHGFTKKGRHILTHEQMAKLFSEMRGTKLAIPGSNGLIQALVANGGQKVAGSITTAIGGPWDVCGVKLVLNAGGFARAFVVIRDDDGITNRFLNYLEVNPLDVMNYDILVTGNTKDTVDKLVSYLGEVAGE